MRNVLCLLLGVAILSFIGCSSKKKAQDSPEKTAKVNKPHFQLTAKERAELESRKSCTLSDALRKRLINDCQELKLTPEELQVLKMTGKVILCGKCGHLLGTDKHKEWKAAHKNDEKPSDDFVPNSLRERILDITTD